MHRRRGVPRPRKPPDQTDQTDTAFLTIDPPGSMDLDQAMHISRLGNGKPGYRVRYAIADVAAFVTPGDAVDVEAHVRGRDPVQPRHANAAAPTLDR